MRTSCRGMALPIILLLLLALTAFGHGALLLSRRELQATWAFRSLVRSSQAAEIGLRLGFAVPVDGREGRTPWTSYPLVSGETEDGLLYRANRRWLDTEFFLLEGHGGAKGWAGERKIGWIGWSLFPGARLRAFLGAAEVGSVLVRDSGVRVDMEGVPVPGEEGRHPECEVYRSLLDSLFSGRPFPPLVQEVEMEENPAGPGSSIPSLGLLNGPEILRRARASGTGTLPDLSIEMVQGCTETGSLSFEGTPGDPRSAGGQLLWPLGDRG